MANKETEEKWTDPWKKNDISFLPKGYAGVQCLSLDGCCVVLVGVQYVE